MYLVDSPLAGVIGKAFKVGLEHAILVHGREEYSSPYHTVRYLYSAYSKSGWR